MVVKRISSHVVATHTVTDFIDIAVDEEACMKANQIKPGMYFLSPWETFLVIGVQIEGTYTNLTFLTQGNAYSSRILCSYVKSDSQPFTFTTDTQRVDV
jgi:hypothetical protein